MIHVRAVFAVLLALLAGACAASGAMVEPPGGTLLDTPPGAVRVLVDAPVEPALARAQVPAGPWSALED